MKKRKIILEIIAFLLMAAILVVGLYHLGCAMLPDRWEFGAVWETYLNEKKNTVDVLYLGTSMVYCDICPAGIYDRTGLTGFVMAGPSQDLPVTYAYLRECCKTQTPQAVMLDITALFFKQDTKHNMVNVCYMPFGDNRIRAAKSCADGTVLSALFPLYEYHNAVFEPAEPYDAKAENRSRMEAGFTLMAKGKPQGKVKNRVAWHMAGDGEYATNLNALKDIGTFCEERGIKLVLYFAPAMRRVPDDLREQAKRNLSGVTCTLEDWSALAEEISVDNKTDWYDEYHFCVGGAEKFTDYVAEYLSEMQLQPAGAEDTALWQERVAWWRKAAS